VKLTTHLHLVPRLRTSGVIPPLLSWPAIRTNLLLRYLFFWDVTRRWLVVSRRRFGTTCPPHLQGMGCPEMSLATNQRCVTSQKSKDLIHTAAETWNHANLLLRLSRVRFFLARDNLSYILCHFFPSFSSPPFQSTDLFTRLRELWHSVRWSLIFNMTGCGAGPIVLTITGTKPVLLSASRILCSRKTHIYYIYIYKPESLPRRSWAGWIRSAALKLREMVYVRDNSKYYHQLVHKIKTEYVRKNLKRVPTCFDVLAHHIQGNTRTVVEFSTYSVLILCKS
jgi:hypothetical protein